MRPRVRQTKTAEEIEADAQQEMAIDAWGLFLMLGGEDLLYEWIPYYEEIVDATTFISDLWGAYGAVSESNYYYYTDGVTVGAGITDAIFIADKYLDFLGLENKPQWARYNPVLDEIYEQEQEWKEENCDEEDGEECHIDWIDLGGTAEEFAEWVEHQEELEELEDGEHFEDEDHDDDEDWEDWDEEEWEDDEAWDEEDWEDEVWIEEDGFEDELLFDEDTAPVEETTA